MSADAERQQAKMKEFMSLLPLTIEIAGLPTADHGKYFTEGQLEARVGMLKTAFNISARSPLGSVRLMLPATCTSGSLQVLM